MMSGVCITDHSYQAVLTLFIVKASDFLCSGVFRNYDLVTFSIVFVEKKVTSLQ